MSVHALSCILGTGAEEGRSQSSGYARLVFLGIANPADDHGFAWPKIRSLAKAANVHRSTVNRRLDELIALGELRMFTRGHYQSPVFVMSIVDHPLSTSQIVERLVELDPRAEWHERVVDPSGEATEVPVPIQGSLDQRSSQSATISENNTVVSRNSQAQAVDLGKQADDGRETGRNRPTVKIVADRDNLGEIVAERDEIVADSDEIVAVARRSSEPSENRITTPPTTTGLPREPDSGRGGGIEDPDPKEIARQWCDMRGVRFAGRITITYPAMIRQFLEHHPPPSDEFLARALDEGIKHPSGWMWVTGAVGAVQKSRDLPDCERCDNRRWLGRRTDNGQLVKVDSEHDYKTVVRCPGCWLTEEKTG